MSPFPISPKPEKWLRFVDDSPTPAELDALRRCAQRNSPFGSRAWAKKTAKLLGLESSIRDLGRPRRH